MRYLILLWGDRAGEEALSPDERRAIVGRHMKLSERLLAEGKLVHGDPLAPGGKVVRDGLVTAEPGPRRRGAAYIRCLSASTLATNGSVTP